MTQRQASAGSLRGIWQWWYRFWFEPVSTVSIALFRMIYGALLLAFVALLLPDLMVWFSRGGPFTVEDAARFWGEAPDYSVLIWFPQPAAVLAFFAVFALASFCLMVGLWTRVAALIVFAGLVSIGHRNPLILHGGDTAMRLMAFYLILAPAGASLSVDRLIAVARGKQGAQSALAPPWAQRLLQLQICFIYAMTVLLKLRGHAWLDGTALYYTAHLEDFKRFPVPFVFDHMLLINLMTYWTIATELSLAFLVWAPGLRRLVLLNGVALHLGIEYSMNIPLFAFTMIAAYLVFVDVEGTWARVLAWRPLRSLPRATLFAGADSRRWAGALAVLRDVDILGRLTAVAPAWTAARGAPATLAGGVRLELADGRRLEGYAAVRWLAWRAPLLWPLAPFTLLPGAAWCAGRCYRLGVRPGHMNGSDQRSARVRRGAV